MEFVSFIVALEPDDEIFTGSKLNNCSIVGSNAPPRIDKNRKKELQYFINKYVSKKRYL